MQGKIMKSIHWYALAAGVLLCLPASLLFSDSDYTDSLETEFVNGGQVTIRLSAGEHRITASPDDHIRIHWRVNSRDNQNVAASTDVEGNSAKVEVDGPRKNFRTIIEVPRHSDLTVRLTAGELHVGNVEGSRDIRLRAGDLSIEVGETENYANVEGSLWAGDISAGPFGQEASGLFRSIEWQGEGKQDLRFKLYAGDVQLYRQKD